MASKIMKKCALGFGMLFLLFFAWMGIISYLLLMNARQIELGNPKPE